MINISINGRKIQCNGSCVAINNGVITVDGKVVENSLPEAIQIVVEGNVERLSCESSVVVNGNCRTIDCGGSCSVKGDVTGLVTAGGSVNCGNVSGDVHAGGSISMKR